MTYSFKKGLIKGITAVVCFGVPFLLTQFPEVANLTIGAVALMLVNFIKVKIAE